MTNKTKPLKILKLERFPFDRMIPFGWEAL